MSKAVGLQRAIVVDNQDPAGRGRVQVRRAQTAATQWLEIVGWGSPGIPQIGASVLVLDDGDAGYVVGVIGAIPLDQASEVVEVVTPAAPQVSGIRIFDAQDREFLWIQLPPGSHVQIQEAADPQAYQHMRVVARGPLRVEADDLTLGAARITLDAPLVRCSGTLQCESVTADSVVAARYAPGIGNRS